MDFPDDHALNFVRDFPAVVAPEYRNRSILKTGPSTVIIRVPASAHPAGTDRVVAALAAALHDNGKLVPLAELSPADDAALLSEAAGVRLGQGAPAHMTPDRFPHFQVMRDLVSYVRGNPGAWEGGSQERELRLHAAERRARRGGLLRLTRVGVPPGDGGIKSFLVHLLVLTGVQRAPRWLWARRTSRKVMRAWLRKERIAAGGRDLFRVMDTAGALWGRQLSLDPDHEEALADLERLLVLALLADLRTPAVGRVLPGRRRRTARPVLLVKLPPAGEPGARAAERFLLAVHRASAGARPPGPLIVAVGRPSAALLEKLGGPREVGFDQASQRLTQNDAPVLVSLGEQAMERPGLNVARVAPRTFRFGRRVPAAFVTCAAVLAAASATPVIAGPDRSCVGGAESVAESARSTPIPVDSKGWYDAALRSIDEQNRRAEQAAAQGATVRTVVAYVSAVPTDENETPFDGTIPELRGIALWQKRLLDNAESDDAIVALRVEVQPTGPGFADAVGKARDLAARVRAEDGSAGSEDAGSEDVARRRADEARRVVGVLGYAQSRNETREALRVLGDAKIPTVGTTATADEMPTGAALRTYWPFTPTNETEARIAANFASGSNIVAEPGSEDDCTPAERALVVESSADLYSRSLAARFRQRFPGVTETFNFHQGGRFHPAPPPGAANISGADELARRLCRELKAEPASVVYWSARARDFTAFINAMDTQGTCIGDDITVLGGNELTNIAQTGAFHGKDWLRLYYSAHRPPASYPGASEKTGDFIDAYTAYVARTTKGQDPWVHDGHSAVSYDAFHALSEAVRRARSHDPSVSRQSVLVALGGGVTFNGATGYVSYDRGGNAPPVDKTLVLFRQFAEPRAVVVCGAYRQGASSRKQGPPCSGGEDIAGGAP